MIPHVKSDSSSYSDIVSIINLIIDIVESSGNKKLGATLYLGFEQKKALHSINPNDPASIKDKSFYGWPIIWVMEDSYIRFT